MPFVNIRIVKDVISDDPIGKKTKMAEKIVAAITETTSLGKDDVWIVFEEVAARDWFVGPTSIERTRAK